MPALKSIRIVAIVHTLALTLALAATTALNAAPPGYTQTVSAAPKPEGPWKDFPTRLVSTLPGYAPKTVAAPATQLSQYGGNTAQPARKATGYFRTEKIGNRWWLIDPEGFPAIHIALIGVQVAQSSETAKAAMLAKYDTRQTWADTTMATLRDAGFNAVGIWSDLNALRNCDPAPAYTTTWSFLASYARKTGATDTSKFAPFIFDPAFEAFCADYAERQLAATKDDPRLIGHFSDSELPINRTTLDTCLALPEGNAARAAAETWLAKYRNVTKAQLRAEPPIDEERAAFAGFTAERYYKLTTAAIRKTDPNHLCLGARMDMYAAYCEPMIAAAGRSLDAFSINYYNSWTPDAALLSKWQKWSGKPFLVTEWYAKGQDAGFPTNKSGIGWVVKTQDDRGRFYQNFALALLESRSCIGWQWFRYRDTDADDKTAGPGGSDGNKGVFKLDFEPYAPLLTRMMELNTQVYPIINYMDTAKR